MSSTVKRTEPIICRSLLLSFTFPEQTEIVSQPRLFLQKQEDGAPSVATVHAKPLDSGPPAKSNHARRLSK